MKTVFKIERNKAALHSDSPFDQRVIDHQAETMSSPSWEGVNVTQREHHHWSDYIYNKLPQTSQYKE